MFIIICILTLFLGYWSIVQLSHLNKEKNHQRYQQLSILRELIQLCREHRRYTHHVLANTNATNRRSDLRHIRRMQNLVTSTTQHLATIASPGEKSKYRILSTNLIALTTGWRQNSMARNQLEHGKAIRHCIYLVDELMIDWLLKNSNVELEQRYLSTWHQILDGMDSLTQLRIAMVEDGVSQHKVLRNAHLISRRIKQLSMANNQPLSTPARLSIYTRLDQLIEHDADIADISERYQLTSDISEELFASYDTVLNVLCESFYQPLNDVRLNSNPVMSAEK